MTRLLLQQSIRLKIPQCSVWGCLGGEQQPQGARIAGAAVPTVSSGLSCALAMLCPAVRVLTHAGTDLQVFLGCCLGHSACPATLSLFPC